MQVKQESLNQYTLKVQRRSRKQGTTNFNNKGKTTNQHLDLPIIATNADTYVTVYTHNQMQLGQYSPLESSYPVTAGPEYFNHAKEQQKSLIPTI